MLEFLAFQGCKTQFFLQPWWCLPYSCVYKYCFMALMLWIKTNNSLANIDFGADFIHCKYFGCKIKKIKLWLRFFPIHFAFSSYLQINFWILCGIKFIKLFFCLPKLDQPDAYNYKKIVFIATIKTSFGKEFLTKVESFPIYTWKFLCENIFWWMIPLSSILLSKGWNERWFSYSMYQKSNRNLNLNLCVLKFFCLLVSKPISLLSILHYNILHSYRSPR